MEEFCINNLSHNTEDKADDSDVHEIVMIFFTLFSISFDVC